MEIIKERDARVKLIDTEHWSVSDCDNPAVLSVGTTYTLVREIIHSWHTRYVLKEVPGQFNSAMFEEVA
jgi:hypothetical protein